MLTFGEFKHGPASQSSGMDVESRLFMDYTNWSVRQLLRRGNWWGTVQPMLGCVNGGCAVWPPFVSSVLAINSCGRSVELANRWYSFSKWDSNCLALARGCGHNRNSVVPFDGTTPVFNQVTNSAGVFLRVYINQESDAGKKIVFFGVDSNGQIVRSLWDDGLVHEGYQMILSLPLTESTIRFRKVSRVLKDETSDVVRVYQWDGTTLNPDSSPAILDMAVYQPKERSPDYLQSRMASTCCWFFTALVKLSYVPICCDSDVVLIDNEEAMANMIQARRYNEQGNVASSRAYEAEAFRELNFQLKDRFPDEQFIMHFRPFGHDTLARQRIGRMI
jgi:hypothetical protein